MKEYNIILAGVGGQGVLTLAAAIARAALAEGYNIKASELHGLAMRFGSLEVHLKIGKELFSPLVTFANADLIISQEPIEAVRNLKYANKKTTFLFSTEPIIPHMVYLEKQKYPTLKEIKNMISKKIIAVDASKIKPRVIINAYLLGRLAAEEILPIKKKSYIKGLKEVIPTKTLKKNLETFELGYESK